ncbi:MAG: arylesterase [Acidobacteriota bacterium]
MKTILFLGDSLTAGYGLDSADAYPAVIQQKIQSLGLNFEVVNGGLSGETSAGGVRRLDWLLRRQVEILVVALGSNDGLRGIPVEETRKNLQSIITKARKRYPSVKVVLAGMQIPPTFGQQYTRDFRDAFLEVARTYRTAWIPFLLDGVGGKPELNLPDRIHPNAEGHRIVAENVWKVLYPVLKSLE